MAHSRSRFWDGLTLLARFRERGYALTATVGEVLKPLRISAIDRE
jgi:hypothetical protein